MFESSSTDVSPALVYRWEAQRERFGLKIRRREDQQDAARAEAKLKMKLLLGIGFKRFLFFFL